MEMDWLGHATTARAAIMTETKKDLEFWDVEVGAPRANEVLVRWAASGVCHTDVNIRDGVVDLPLPAVLGHEGAGVIEQVGTAVTNLTPGDHIILLPTPACGECFSCRRGSPQVCERGRDGRNGGLLDGKRGLRAQGAPVSQLCFSGTFIERTVLPEISAVKIDPTLPLEYACIIGCGLSTGFGAAKYTGEVRAGDIVVVTGCGGVGLGAIQAARIQDAERIVAIDVFDAKLQVAAQVGATDVCNPTTTNATDMILHLTNGRGADVVIDATGSPAVLEQLPSQTRAGGKMVLAGLPAPSYHLALSTYDLAVSGKSLRGHRGRGADPQMVVSEMAHLWQAGQLRIEELVSEFIDLDDVNGAFSRLEHGDVTKSVIRYDAP